MQTRRYRCWKEEPGTGEKVRDHKIPLSAGRHVIEARNAMDYEKIRERASTYTLRKVYALHPFSLLSPSVLSALFANSRRSRIYTTVLQGSSRTGSPRYLLSGNLHATPSAKLTPTARYKCTSCSRIAPFPLDNRRTSEWMGRPRKTRGTNGMATCRLRLSAFPQNERGYALLRIQLFLVLLLTYVITCG